MKIGLDPTGGTTPFGAGVIWSIERAVYDRYDAGFMVEATATHPSMTAFLLSAPEWPKKHNDIYWDDASLEVIRDVGGLSDEASGDEVVLLLTSETQRVGQPVTVRVTSPYLLEDMHLNVSGPAGGVTLRWLGVSSAGHGHAWRWEFVPAVEGPYTATVGAMGINAISATTRIGEATASSEAPPQIRPVVRGQPRAQYERTYVLLPPSAGKEWVQVVIDSGMWLNKRWTLGFSRDDAGIGDLDKRTVIVINPSAWPEPADVWFALWYPGVRVRTITAASPSELLTALRAFVP